MLFSVQFTHKKLLNWTSCPHLSILMILKYDSCNETYFHILTNDSCLCLRRCYLAWSPDSPWMFLTLSSSGLLKSGCQEVLWLATRHIQIVSSSRSCHVIRDTAWQRDNGGEIMTGVSHLPRPAQSHNWPPRHLITWAQPGQLIPILPWLDNQHPVTHQRFNSFRYPRIVIKRSSWGWWRWCLDNIRIKTSSSNQFNLDLTLLLAENKQQRIFWNPGNKPLMLILAPLLCQWWIIRIEYKPRIF